jgi:hypothetical protein
LGTFDKCPVCDGEASGEAHGYTCCKGCGHRWKQTVAQVEIENDILSARSLVTPDRLTAAKMLAVARLTRSRGSLLDFGAGSGKFVYFSKTRFGKAEGVEVTTACISCARDVLGVTLWPELPAGARYDVITAWHVLEHLPPQKLRAEVATLHRCSNEAFILSVPNADSWASRWFGDRYPYRDAVSHFHEFTPGSMRLLLQRCGWRKVVPFRVWIYSVFCYAQGLTNLTTGTHNLLYFRLKRGKENVALPPVGLSMHVLLFLAFIPLAVVVTLMEFAALERATCIHVACYKDET